MPEFEAYNPDVEVNGRTVLSIVNGMGLLKNLGLKILTNNKIENPQKGRWYNQQYWLNAFKQISEEIGSYTLFEIGKSIPENAEFPPHIDSIHNALASIDIAYHMNHRLNGTPLYDPMTGKLREGIGHYKYIKIGDKQVEMLCDNPYPCDFDHGIIYAMVNKFKPSNSQIVNIEHDYVKSCRSNGDNTCSYIVTWR